jgi:hypothetical protein
LIFDSIEVDFGATLLDEGSVGNLRGSGVILVLAFFHFLLFELHGKLLLLLNSVLSLNNILLGLVVDPSEADDSEGKNKKSGRDHDNNPRSRPIISRLDLNDSWIKLLLLNDLFNGDVLVDSLLFKNGLDVWSED